MSDDIWRNIKTGQPLGFTPPEGHTSPKSDWDIPAQPNFNEDLAFGERGERTVRTFIQAIVEGSFEVKTDRFRNGNMVVEIEQNPGKRGWRTSGLAITKAHWWVYQYSPDGAMVVVSTTRLWQYVSRFHPSRIRTFAQYSDNPSRGYLLTPAEVVEMMSSPTYDEVDERHE